MIWIIEIPIIVFVIIGMLVGSIQVGTILRVVGIIMLIASLVWLAVVKSNESDERDQSAVAIFFAVQGLLVFLFGIWFGEHSLFEFLFGTGGF